MSAFVGTDRWEKEKGDYNCWDKIVNPSYVAAMGGLFPFQKISLLSETDAAVGWVSCKKKCYRKGRDSCIGTAPTYVAMAM